MELGLTINIAICGKSNQNIAICHIYWNIANISGVTNAKICALGIGLDIEGGIASGQILNVECTRTWTNKQWPGWICDSTLLGIENEWSSASGLALLTN
jgi:hypothetical protein